MADRVKVSLGRTINAGNFESIRVDIGMETDVKDGGTRAGTLKALHAQVDKELDAICKPIEAQLSNKK